MYKIVNQLVPDYLHSHCPDLVSRTSAYYSLRFPICRTTAFKNSFFPSTTRPKSVRQGVESHTSAKKQSSTPRVGTSPAITLQSQATRAHLPRQYMPYIPPHSRTPAISSTNGNDNSRVPLHFRVKLSIKTI